MLTPKIETIESLDILIGKRIRFRRNLLGITQEALAKQIGVTFQQIQKYEKGSNKIYASRLYHIANALKCPVAYFYEDDNSSQGLSDNEQEGFEHNHLENPEAANILRVFFDIKDKKKRKNLVEMMKDLKTPQ